MITIFGESRVCTKCDTVKDIEQFSFRYGKRSHTRMHWCKECVSKDRKRRYEERKDIERAQNRAWYQENKPWLNPEVRERINAWRRQPGVRQAEWAKQDAIRRDADGSFTQDEWIALCNIYDNRCINPLCSNPNVRLTVDHVMPISLGGSNNIDNIQPLCMPCNASKGAKFIDYREV